MREIHIVIGVYQEKNQKKFVECIIQLLLNNHGDYNIFVLFFYYVHTRLLIDHSHGRVIESMDWVRSKRMYPPRLNRRRKRARRTSIQY